jgi:hypothetical protein
VCSPTEHGRGLVVPDRSGAHPIYPGPQPPARTRGMGTRIGTQRHARDGRRARSAAPRQHSANFTGCSALVAAVPALKPLAPPASAGVGYAALALQSEPGFNQAAAQWPRPRNPWLARGGVPGGGGGGGGGTCSRRGRCAPAKAAHGSDGKGSAWGKGGRSLRVAASGSCSAPAARETQTRVCVCVCVRAHARARMRACVCPLVCMRARLRLTGRHVRAAGAVQHATQSAVPDTHGSRPRPTDPARPHWRAAVSPHG